MEKILEILADFFQRFKTRRRKHYKSGFFQAAISDGSRSTVDLSFVAAVGDLILELEGFEEFASKPNGHTIVYKVPKSPASNMLLELKIVTVENAPNAWKLVEFRQSNKPPTIAGDGGRWGAGSDERYGFFGGGFGGWA